MKNKSFQYQGQSDPVARSGGKSSAGVKVLRVTMAKAKAKPKPAKVKATPAGGKSPAERELAIQQIISRSVVSTEIVDIMKAAGIETPDISVLSDEFLAEVRDMDKKNLALEALRKLINGEVRSQGNRNVVQAKAFSERLEAAILRYHTNAITTAQVLEELIQLAKDIRAARERGEETGPYRTRT